MNKLPQPSLTRRGFLQTGAAFGANTHALGIGGATTTLAKSVFAPLAPIDPSTLNPLLVDNTLGSIKEMLFSLFNAANQDDFLDYSGYHNNFHSFSLGAVRLLALTPNERAAVLRRPEFADVKSQIDPNGLIKSPEQLLDDDAIISRIYFLWDRLHDNTPDEPLPNIWNYQSDRLQGWKQWGYENREPPSWWPSCNKRERLHVWLECLHAEKFGVPLGYFVKDDQRMIDIMQRNLVITTHGNLPDIPFVDFFARTRTPAFFQAHFGPETWQQHFVRSHELLLRAIGMTKEVAQKRAIENLAEAKTEPPLISVMRVERSLFQHPDKAYYRVQLTTSSGKDFATLFSVYEYIYDQLTTGLSKGNHSSKVSFTNDGELTVTVPKMGNPKEKMDRFCLECFQWDRQWINDLPSALEPEPRRERVRSQELALWKELKFHL